jgi:predicted RNA-binding protein with PIN domain
MHLLIDGYNLLHQTPWAVREWRAAREALLRALALYQTRSGHDVTVIFDGKKGGWPTEQRTVEQGVLVCYTRRETEADDVIRREIAREPHRYLVVTSDRAVAQTCKALGVGVVTSVEFADRLAGKVIAHRVVPRKEMDDDESPPPQRGSQKRGNPRKLSKAERRKRQVLGKL